jgi:hypothetical protein
MAADYYLDKLSFGIEFGSQALTLERRMAINLINYTSSLSLDITAG